MSPFIQLPRCLLLHCPMPENRPRPINGSISLSDACCLFRLKVAVPPLTPCSWRQMGQGRVASTQATHPLSVFPFGVHTPAQSRPGLYCSGFRENGVNASLSLEQLFQTKSWWGVGAPFSIPSMCPSLDLERHGPRWLQSSVFPRGMADLYQALSRHKDESSGGMETWVQRS